MATTDLIVRLIGQSDRLRADLNKVDSNLNGLQKTIGQVSAAFGFAFGGREVIRGITQGIRKIADFEQQMDTVAAVSRASAEEVQELTDNALDLGRKSKFTASQIGSMQESLARLGFTTDEITGTTDAVRKLATAAGEELAPSAEIMAGTMKSFNLEAAQSERVANVMAESFSTTSLNLEKFGVAMANVGAIAEVSNESLEATAAKLGTLVDRNIEASKAGTDLRRIFINLADSGMSYDDAMETIRNSTDKVSTATDLFGDRAAAAAIILAENDKKVRELAKGYGDANEELQKMVDIMEDNLNNDLLKLQSAIDGVILKGDTFTGVIRDIVQGLTTLVNQVSNLADTDFGGTFRDIVSNIIPGLNVGLELLRANTRAFNAEQERLNQELAKTEQQIQRTVEAAFDSGNVEAYIKALDQNIHREEIVKRIRERQAEEGRRAFAASFPADYGKEIQKHPGILASIREKLKKLTEAREFLTVEGDVRKANAEIEKLEQKLASLLATESGDDIAKRIQDALFPSGTRGDDIAKQAQQIFEAFAPQGPSTLPGVDELLAKVKSGREGFAAESQAFLDQLIGWDQMVQTIQNGVSASIGGAFDAIGEAIFSGIDPIQAAGQALLQTFSQFIGQLGDQMIGSGIGLIAASASLKNPFTSGPALIAVGAILKTLSGAIRGFASGIQGGVSGVSSTGSVGGGTVGGSEGQTGLNFSPAQEKVQVNVVGKIQGTDLVFLLDKENRNKGLIG